MEKSKIRKKPTNEEILRALKNEFYKSELELKIINRLIAKGMLPEKGSCYFRRKG